MAMDHNDHRDMFWPNSLGGCDARISQAVDYWVVKRHRQPALDDLAELVDLSSDEFHRLFVKETGILPETFAKALALVDTGTLLRGGQATLAVDGEQGRSSASRLHDLPITVEVMTPGEYKTRGRGLVIHHQIIHTLFGSALALMTARGLCGLEFINDRAPKAHEAEQARLLTKAQKRWPAADFSPANTSEIKELQQTLNGRGNPSLRLLLAGTPFQVAVWEYLLDIPASKPCSYKDIAVRNSNDKAAQAVGGAVGANPLALLIPCHRVLQKSGALGGYAGTPDRKIALLAFEAAWSRIAS